jgi:hypothetical protein
VILPFLAVLPTLFWSEGSQTAPQLQRAGIIEIAVPAGGAAAWSATGIKAVELDPSKLEQLDAPGIDYQLGRAGATAVPWVKSNLWRMARTPAKSFFLDVAGAAVPLAVAEAYASNTRVYIKVKPADFPAYSAAFRFLNELAPESMKPRANFTLVDDGSSEMDEVMNLLVRRNLLFTTVKPGEERHPGMVVRVGSGDYTKDAAADPYAFAAIIRSKISDAKRLVRLYGTETTLARLYGDDNRARLHLIQYGRNSIDGVRVRVLGKYPRVLIAMMGQRLCPAEDIVVDDSSTEFTIPTLRDYAVIDLDASQPATLMSVFSAADLPLTADPSSAPWKTAPKVVIAQNSFGQPLRIGSTEVRSRWTRDALYLLYSAPYDQLYLHPNPVTDRDTPSLWDWDVAEAFIGSDFDKIGQYHEFQVSPQSEWVDLEIDVLHPKPASEGMQWNSGYQVKARIDEAHKVWYAEMRIPLSALAAKQLSSGDRLRLGLFRCTGMPPDRIYVSWQPAFRRTFHTPEAFGTLVLQGPPQQGRASR